MATRISPLDERSMAEALRLALSGAGRVHPNPLVGALLVKGGRVVGRGAHRRFGGAHAEVRAVADAGKRAAGATLYVTLEPCPHTGKTPPCTDLIVRSGIRRVVVGCLDPNPRVAGGGVRALRRAGIEVRVGCLEGLCLALNRDFARWVRTRKPYVTIKVAQSLDGRIATRTGASKWISGPSARKLAQSLRAASDAILIGVGTLLEDDPLLSVRGSSAQPLKVIVDSKLKTPPTARIFSKASPGKVILATTAKAPPSKARLLERRGAEVWRLKTDRAGRVDLKQLLTRLGERGVVRVLAEGGGEIIASLLKDRAVQEVYWITAPFFIGGRDARPSVGGEGIASLSQCRPVKDWNVSRLGDDLLFHGELPCSRA